MKNTMKVFLMIVLFCSAAFADGDMPTGNKNCPVGQTCLTSSPDGDMGSGGITASPDGDMGTGNITAKEETDYSFLESIVQYLASVV